MLTAAPPTQGTTEDRLPAAPSRVCPGAQQETEAAAPSSKKKKKKKHTLPHPEVADAAVAAMQKELRDARAPPYRIELFEHYPVVRHWRWWNAGLKWFRHECNTNKWLEKRLPDHETHIPIVEHNNPQNPTSFDFKLDDRYPWCWMEMIASLQAQHMREVVQKGIICCKVRTSCKSYDFFTHASERKGVKKGMKPNPQLRDQNEIYDFIIERIMESGESNEIRLHPDWCRNACRVYYHGHTEASPPGELGASEGYHTYKRHKQLDVGNMVRFDGKKIGAIPAVAGQSIGAIPAVAGESRAASATAQQLYSLTAAPGPASSSSGNVPCM